MAQITALEARDVRFPTSRDLDGSDAMNPVPDYSLAYVTVRTDADDGLEGNGFAFTIGRGTELQVAAIDVLAPLLVGSRVEDVFADMGEVWRRLTHDSQLRWLGPEKGVIHMAAAAVVNALWDLYAKREGKPLWKLLVDMTPEQLVALVDFRYLTDVLTPDEALAIIGDRAPSRAEREARLRIDGYPAYNTSIGWLGYDDEKLAALSRQAVAEGWSHVKLKVGASTDDDVRRAGIVRDIIGPNRQLMLDANQIWSVPDAIVNMQRLARFDPWWIEEPTSPDDVLGHANVAKAIAPIAVASGEHAHNRVMFKQLLQMGAIGFCQVDACRLGGVNEVIAVLLLAAKFDVPVCPHAGGVGLSELVQHLAMFDFVAVSGSMDDRVIEYVTHLHEHFVVPAVVNACRYRVPVEPGFSSSLKPESLDAHAFPDGPAWTT